MYLGRHVTVIIPALNEEPSIGRVLDGLFRLQVCLTCGQDCGQEIRAASAGYQLRPPDQTSMLPGCDCQPIEESVKMASGSLVDRIIVCDNGSTDNTAAIAEAHGAMVTHESDRGYGAACQAALNVPAEKDIIVFVDADHSVVATELPQLLTPLFEGADLVIGSRTLGHTQKGALSIPQQFGNHLASALIRFLWSANVTDLGPFRAITNTALQDIQMTDRRFGWTVEMQVRALQLSQTVTEVPVSTRCRIGKSKIGGTVQGVIGAAHGILGTIAKLYWAGLSGSPEQVSAKRN